MPMRACLVALVLAGAGLSAQSYQNTAPETFRANAQATATGGGVAAAFVFQVDAYTPDADRERLVALLTSGGSPAFVEALKQGKAIGYVELGTRKVVIRYARAQASANGGRRIVLVTDAPVFFVGGGELEAKARDGYDVAVVEFEVDSVGLGSGRMAAAAKVKAGGPAGVAIDDYAQEPIKLVTVTRTVS